MPLIDQTDFGRVLAAFVPGDLHRATGTYSERTLKNWRAGKTRPT